MHLPQVGGKSKWVEIFRGKGKGTAAVVPGAQRPAKTTGPRRHLAIHELAASVRNYASCLK